MVTVKYCKTTSELESEIEFTEGGIIYRKTNTKVFKALVCVAVILFVICSVLAALYVSEKLSSKSDLGICTSGFDNKTRHEQNTEQKIKPTNSSSTPDISQTTYPRRIAENSHNANASTPFPICLTPECSRLSAGRMF